MNSYYANSELDENNQLVKRLKENLKSKNKELCETRRWQDENKVENNKLNKTNQIIETDLKCLNTKFDDAVSCKSRLTSERDSINDDLEMKSQKLSDKDIKDQKFSYDSLFKTLTEVIKSSALNYYKMKSDNQKLQNEICAKKDELCTLRDKMKNLEQENDFNIMEINAQKNKLFEKECSLKRMANISEKILKILKIKKCNVCFCPEKKIENVITYPTYPQPICSTEDPSCCQPRSCTKPGINQQCTTTANVAIDDCNVSTDSTDLQKIFYELELLGI